MPPKKTPAPSKKPEPKKKEKVVEDKTFGLKNKKGGKQQKFIQQVQKQQTGAAPPVDKRKEEKEKKLAEQREMAQLFKPAVPAQKVETGIDPKSVLCAFFKKGTCTKGNKCKFSHDLAVEQKAAKRSIYVDLRDRGDDDMATWDDEKLQEVVNTKHNDEKKRPTTDIICKYFLEAVEKSKYGWYWKCPNGEKCIYRHALPPGYVLKGVKKIEKEDTEPKMCLEDLIEKERAALGPNLTPVTLQSFMEWKKRKLQEKEEKLAAEAERKKADFSRGKKFGISGRELFCFNPELVDDGPMEEGDAAYDSYKRVEEDDDGVEFKEIDLGYLSLAAREINKEEDTTDPIPSTSAMCLKKLAKVAIDIASLSLSAREINEEDDITDPIPSTSAMCLRKLAKIDNEAAEDDVGPINAELFLALDDEVAAFDTDDEEDE